MAAVATRSYTVAMARRDPSLRPTTVEEYLDWEDAESVRHEYVAGEAYAMIGVTRRHNAISLNLATSLHAAARMASCRVSVVDVRLRVGADVVYYPDVMIACGPPPVDPRIEDAPCLVAEVLSPSARRVDRHEKSAVCESISSLGTYLVVEPDRRLVERRWRDADGAWQRETIEGAGTIPLSCPTGLSLTLDPIYAGGELPSPDELRRVREAEPEYA